jgi:hypothetical protein
MSRDAILWTGVLAPPVLWFVCQLAEFAVAPLACAGPGKPALYAITIGSMVLTALVGFIALGQWRQPQGATAQGERAQSMALAGVVLGAGFLLVEVALTLPNLLLAGCE